MANLNVTYEEMRGAANNLRSGQAEIEGMLAKLKSMVDSLVSGGYVTDKSSKAFDASYSEFSTGVSKTIEGLEGMGSYLEKAADTLQQTDEQLAASLG